WLRSKIFLALSFLTHNVLPGLSDTGLRPWSGGHGAPSPPPVLPVLVPLVQQPQDRTADEDATYPEQARVEQDTVRYAAHHVAPLPHVGQPGVHDRPDLAAEHHEAEPDTVREEHTSGHHGSSKSDRNAAARPREPNEPCRRAAGRQQNRQRHARGLA